MVAEVGFEPHDLRVMSPTSYQAALLRDIVASIGKRASSQGGAGDRDRTGTILSYHGILSPGRLPVPPHRQGSTERLFCAPVRFALPIIPYPFHFVNPFFVFSFLFLPSRSLLSLFYVSFAKNIPVRVIFLTQVLILSDGYVSAYHIISLSHIQFAHPSARDQGLPYSAAESFSVVIAIKQPFLRGVQADLHAL